MGRTRFRLFVIAAAALGYPLAATAQEGYRFQITPFVGKGVFSSNLTDAFFVRDESGNPVLFDDAELETAFGGGLHAGVRRGRLAFEGTFAYIPTDFSGHNDSGSVSFDTNVLLYGGSFLYYFENARSVEPYLLLGAGGKHYDPDVEDGGSKTSFTMNAGFGLAFPLARSMALRLELRDYASSFDPGVSGVDSRTQHDLLLTAGVRMSFGSSEKPQEPGSAQPSSAGDEECGTQTTVTSTTMDGAIVTLADGSVWEIREEDRRRTMLWLPDQAAVPCSAMLVDPSNGITVEARKLR